MQGIYQIQNIHNKNKYIGASNNIKRRIAEHFSKSSYMSKTNALSKNIRKYGKTSFTTTILEEVEITTDLPEREIFWINKLQPEYNQHKGGTSLKGSLVSENTKSKIKQACKQTWAHLPNNKKLDIIKNNLIGPKKGHKVSEATRKKLRKANLGKKQTLRTKTKRSIKMKLSMLNNKNGAKKVYSILNGKLFKEYNSIKEAAKAIEIDPSGITCVLKGKQKTSGGFQWVYADTYNILTEKRG